MPTLRTIRNLACGTMAAAGLVAVETPVGASWYCEYTDWEDPYFYGVHCYQSFDCGEAGSFCHDVCYSHGYGSSQVEYCAQDEPGVDVNCSCQWNTCLVDPCHNYFCNDYCSYWACPDNYWYNLNCC